MREAKARRAVPVQRRKPAPEPFVVAGRAPRRLDPLEREKRGLAVFTIARGHDLRDA